MTTRRGHGGKREALVPSLPHLERSPPSPEGEQSPGHSPGPRTWKEAEGRTDEPMDPKWGWGWEVACLGHTGPGPQPGSVLRSSWLGEAAPSQKGPLPPLSPPSLPGPFATPPCPKLAPCSTRSGCPFPRAPWLGGTQASASLLLLCGTTRPPAKAAPSASLSPSSHLPRCKYKVLSEARPQYGPFPTGLPPSALSFPLQLHS